MYTIGGPNIFGGFILMKFVYIYDFFLNVYMCQRTS